MRVGVSGAPVGFTLTPDRSPAGREREVCLRSGAIVLRSGNKSLRVTTRMGSMIGLIQRVSQASVRVQDALVGQIAGGLLALVCAEPGDGEREADALLARMLDYRVFADEAGRMNLGLRSVGGGLLLVPQFTLAADTSSGLRPSFSSAAPPARARALFEYLVGCAQRLHAPVAAGRFGADMQVALVNEGPVTFWLQVRPRAADR
jgi:D-aminoacyl-tRNA deacylase